MGENPRNIFQRIYTASLVPASEEYRYITTAMLNIYTSLYIMFDSIFDPKHTANDFPLFISKHGRNFNALQKIFLGLKLFLFEYLREFMTKMKSITGSIKKLYRDSLMKTKGRKFHKTVSLFSAQIAIIIASKVVKCLKSRGPIFGRKTGCLNVGCSCVPIFRCLYHINIETEYI